MRIEVALLSLCGLECGYGYLVTKTRVTLSVVRQAHGVSLRIGQLLLLARSLNIRVLGHVHSSD